MKGKTKEKFPVRFIPSKKLWEVDCRPYGRIRDVTFRNKPIRLLQEDMAREVRRAILDDIAKGVPEAVAVSPYLPRSSRLEDVARKWIEHLEQRVKRDERSPTYVRRLHDFAGTWTADGERVKAGDWAPLYAKSIYSLNLGVFEDYATELFDDVGPTSVVHTLSALRTCLRWHAKRSSGSYTCPDFPDLSRGEYEPVRLTPEQQDLVLEQIPVGSRGIYLAMCDLMIRPGEARALHVEDYDWKAREFTIRAAMKGSRKDAERRGTKTRRFGDRRVLVATARLAEWIEAHVGAEARLARTVPLFTNPEKRGADPRWPESTLRHVWERARNEAGDLPRSGLYAGTKHSTATWLRQGAGLSLDEIALALGHVHARKGQEVTEEYARPPRLANGRIVGLLDARRTR